MWATCAKLPTSSKACATSSSLPQSSHLPAARDHKESKTFFLMLFLVLLILTQYIEHNILWYKTYIILYMEVIG